jgi:hypothetical protein
MKTIKNFGMAIVTAVAIAGITTAATLGGITLVENAKGNGAQWSRVWHGNLARLSVELDNLWLSAQIVWLESGLFTKILLITAGLLFGYFLFKRRRN